MQAITKFFKNCFLCSCFGNSRNKSDGVDGSRVDIADDKINGEANHAYQADSNDNVTISAVGGGGTDDKISVSEVKFRKNNVNTNTLASHKTSNVNSTFGTLKNGDSNSMMYDTLANASIPILKLALLGNGGVGKCEILFVT